MSHPRTSALTTEQLVARAAAHRPRTYGPVWAATAVVLGEGENGPEVLLIRRVAREGDRWSGDMALPGGKTEEGDGSVEATAARETWEETQVRVGDPVARLDDQRSPDRRTSLGTAVFVVDGLPTPVPQPSEVAAATWVPVAELADPANRTWYRFGGVVPFRSITVGGDEIWGLTHRTLQHFLSVAGLI